MMALPNSSKVKSSAEDQSMKMRAMALTSAKMEFVRDAGTTTAGVAWTTASTPQGRYEFLVPYLMYPPTNLADYSIMGYSINPGNTTTDAAILNRGMTIIDYISANQ